MGNLIRLRNKANGVVVNVDKAGAARLSAGQWESADKPPKQTAAQKKAADEKAAAEAAAAAEAEAAAQAEAEAQAAADAAAAAGTGDTTTE